jgi:integrase
MSMETTMTFEQQAERFMTHIETRRKNPVKVNTIAAYRSQLTKWILPALGVLPMSSVQNVTVKGLVDTMTKAQLSASSITVAVSLVKQIIGSAKDEVTRQPLFPVAWDDEYLDVPTIVPTEQDALATSPAAIEKAISSASERQDKALYALLAGTGIRIGEARALKIGPDDGVNSFWVPERGMLIIRSTVVRGHLQDSTKTLAGTREIDLAPELNEFMKANLDAREGLLFTNREGGITDAGTLYRRLVKAGIADGYHAFRRYRVTHLENNGVPRGIIKFWAGHSGSSDITSRYVKVKEEIAARRTWCEKAGLGFELQLSNT